MRRTMVLMGVLLVMGLVIGCGSNTPGSDPSGRAMQDPMNYRPGFEDSNISGGGLTDFDKKAFRRDVDNVLNP